MEHHKILVSEEYHRDLQKILHYILHDLSAPLAAAGFLEAIEDTVQGLASMPYCFEKVRDETLNRKGNRKCNIKNNLLFYKVFEEEKTVRIYRLLYARRNWIRLL